MPASQTREDPVFSRIRAAAARGALSHAILFTGPGDRLAAARFAAAALECEGGEEAVQPRPKTTPPAEPACQKKPCGVCAACRKVREDIHPDVVTVRDEKHKNLSVAILRDMRQDAYLRPNEGRRKVYIFPDCALLTEQDQNVLLKIVEEGPPYAAFLFCAENPAAVLQTLRSRCVELKLLPTAAERAVSEDWEALCRVLAKGRRGSAAELAARLDKKRLSREDLAALLARCRETLAAALLWLYGRPPAEEEREMAALLRKSLTKAQIMRTIELFGKYYGDCGYNVNPSHVLGALAAELEGIF